MTTTPPQQTEIMSYPAGVDSEEGIRRVANNKKLYDKLLFRIAAELPQNIVDFENALSDSNFENLSILAHTLKGSSANLSITPIKESATRLELAAKNQDASACSAALAELKSKASLYINEINA